MNETEQEQDQALAEFTASALRRNQPGSYEQMLAQHLIMAVAADPITKIRLICEAALMTEGLPSEEHEKVFNIYVVAASFDQTKINIKLDANMTHQIDWHGIIAWSFPKTKESYDKYVKPWVGNPVGLYYKPRHDKKPSQEELDKLKPGEYFFWLTANSHNSALETLKARFIIYCMGHIMQLNAKLCRKISPDTYTELLSKVKQ